MPAFLALWAISCGAGSRPAPFSENGHEATECGEIDDLAPNILKFLRDGHFTPMAEVFQQEVVPSGKMRSFISAILLIGHEAPPPAGLFKPIGEILQDASLKPLFDLVKNLLRYLAGVTPFTQAHYEVTTALGQSLMICDQNGPLTLVDKLITTRLPVGCVGTLQDCQLASTKLLRDVGTLLSNVALRDLLGSLSIAAVPEESFVTLLEQFVAIASSPNFEFSQLRTVLQNNVYPLIDDPQLKADLDVVMNDLDQVTQPETGVQVALASTLSCFQAQDPKRGIYHMLYNIVVDPNVQFAELLSALNGVGQTDPDEKVAKWLHQVIGVVTQRRATNDAIIGLVALLLEEKNAKRVLPTVIELADAGAAADLQNIISRGLSGCSKRPLETTP